MNEKKLIETINSSILVQGFARIPASDVISAFASEGIDISRPFVALESLAQKQGWHFAHPAATQSNEYIFFRSGGMRNTNQADNNYLHRTG